MEIQVRYSMEGIGFDQVQLQVSTRGFFSALGGLRLDSFIWKLANATSKSCLSCRAQ
jgi:hypothetical protein